MVIPFVEASHLAPSSSFFSAVLQPLGLRFIDADSPGDDSCSNPNAPPRPSVTYGANGKAVLQIYQALSPSPRLSSLVLTAPSRSAVARFHASALKANPLLKLLDTPRLSSRGPTSYAQASKYTAWLSTDDGGVSRAVAHDLDGNRMEVVYPDPMSRKDPVHYTGKPVRKTQSTREEVGRILDWNYDVASASPSTSSRLSPPASAAPPRPLGGPAMSRHHQEPSQSSQSLRRTVHSDIRPHQPRELPLQQAPPAPSHISHPHASAQAQQSADSGGLSTTAVVGALLGAAAGAALTYGLVTKERSRVPHHDVDPVVSPGLPRRATFPERLTPASHAGLRYDGREKGQRLVDVGAGGYSTRRIAYADVVDDHEMAWPPPKYLPQHSHQEAGTTSHRVAKSAPRGRAVDDSFDTRSRHSSRFTGARTRSVRSRSEAPIARAPVDPLELDQRSYAVSRHSAVPRSSHTHSHVPRVVYEPEQESYVSAQTHRSAATARKAPSRAPEPAMEQELVYRSRAGSKVSTARPLSVARTVSAKGPPSYVSARNIPLPPSDVGMTMSARNIPLPPSDVGMTMSARNIPLPPSDVGSSHANWNDDLCSVAPSDSISCVGSKTSRRSRRHH